jgi:CRP-like cAMP-binding protein
MYTQGIQVSRLAKRAIDRRCCGLSLARRSVAAPTVWERRPLYLQDLRIALPIAYVHRAPRLPLCAVHRPSGPQEHDATGVGGSRRTLGVGDTFGEAGALGGEAEALTVVASTAVTALVAPYAALAAELRPATLESMAAKWRPHAEQRRQQVAQQAASLQARAHEEALSPRDCPGDTLRVARSGSAGSTRSRSSSRSSRSRPGSALGSSKPPAAPLARKDAKAAVEAKPGRRPASGKRPPTGHPSAPEQAPDQPVASDTLTAPSAAVEPGALASSPLATPSQPSAPAVVEPRDRTEQPADEGAADRSDFVVASAEPSQATAAALTEEIEFAAEVEAEAEAAEAAVVAENSLVGALLNSRGRSALALRLPLSLSGERAAVVQSPQQSPLPYHRTAFFGPLSTLKPRRGDLECVPPLSRGCCIAYGGGRRCQHLGCAKSAEGVGTQHCKAHGGGKRCQEEGCTKSARGDTGCCIAHGVHPNPSRDCHHTSVRTFSSAPCLPTPHIPQSPLGV